MWHNTRCAGVTEPLKLCVYNIRKYLLWPSTLPSQARWQGGFHVARKPPFWEERGGADSQIPYSNIFQGIKLSRFGTKQKFRRENFRGLLRSNYYVGAATEFCGQNFHGWSETTKNVSLLPQKFLAIRYNKFIILPRIPA